MSIEDYALELGISSEEVISTLKSLGYKYSNKDDILDDEAIIVLDNELGSLSDNENLSDELKDKFEMEDRAEEAAMAYNIELDSDTQVKEKIEKKDNSNKSSKKDKEE
jgi:hypothetical protein